MYTVTVTSQGQITLPADLRRKLNIQKNDTLTISINDKNKATIEKLPTVLELAGTLSKYSKVSTKNMTIEQILKAEQQAVDEGLKERWERKLQETDDL